MTLTEYILAHPHSGKFRPSFRSFLPFADWVEVFFEDHDFAYLDRLTDEIDLYKTMEGKVVGVKLYGVQASINKTVADHFRDIASIEEA